MLHDNGYSYSANYYTLHNNLHITTLLYILRITTPLHNNDDSHSAHYYTLNNNRHITTLLCVLHITTLFYNNDYPYSTHYYTHNILDILHITTHNILNRICAISKTKKKMQQYALRITLLYHITIFTLT